ncbi:hypothetical protein BJX62DRAFT_82052 [Aspergillus germanicus]
MVYRGKPSKACSECRIKRRKCDLSSPACRQCVRAGSKCDGYRDGNLITFRDQTVETLGKIPLYPDNNPLLVSFHGNQGGSSRSRLSQQAQIYQDKKQTSHDPWSKLAITPEDQAVHFFFYHYAVQGSSQARSHPDCLSIINARATGSGYLADIIIAVGMSSLASLKNAATLTHAASRTFSRALRDIRAALEDPAEATSDQMLVAVMLLALYETVTSDSDGDSNPWDRHVDGALALIQLRGAGQLHNRISRCIFHNLTTEILINCLQRGLRAPITLINLMVDARKYETAQEEPATRLADMIVSVCAIVASGKEDTKGEDDLFSYISALLSIDTDLECWTQILPAEYEYTTLTEPDEPRGTEAHMGRYDTYTSVEIAHMWNLQRCARITLRQALIETLSKHPNKLSSQPKSPFLPISISYTHLLHASNAVIEENTSDICYSAPYILHGCNKAGKSSDLRAARILHLLWPLYIAGTARTANDALRVWVASKLQIIGEVTGIQEARRTALSIQQQCLAL